MRGLRWALVSMRARAERTVVADDARCYLDQWRDYGDPDDLDRAIEILRRTRDDANVRGDHRA